ncbi:MAG: radical SAM family heme chaperone HemW [Oscillospiraceae bacterium]
MSIGIYIHVPFCLRKCPYCDFYSVKFNSDSAEKYVDAVCRNIKKYMGKGLKADTVYFGGGTPSLLSSEQLSRIINTIDSCFVTDNPEITIEANPCSVNLNKLTEYRIAGVNRISFGVQSADDNRLEFLGRLHNFETAKQAVYDAEKAGIKNISCDIMLGLPGDSINSLEDTVSKITAFPVYHISAYMLKIERNTPFDCDRIRNAVADEDLQCDMYLKTVDMLSKAGFEQYEISNFAKQGSYSRHNLKYWQGEEYLGFGPAAHSFFEGKRFHVPKNVVEFINNNYQTEIVSESNPDRLEEYIMLSLRLKWGISLKRIEQLGGHEFSESILTEANRLSQVNLCLIDGDRISLTPRGFLVSNSIISDFLALRK